MLVEMEIRQSNPETEKATTTKIDINEIIGKVKDFVDSIKRCLQTANPWQLTLIASIFQ